MKTVFRPIPITLLDFLSVLLPGWVWLFLISATIDFVKNNSVTPASAWQKLYSLTNQGGSWLGPLTLVFAALIAGSLLKPLSNKVSQKMTKYLFKLSKYYKAYNSKDLVFPYDSIFSSKTYYSKVIIILNRLFGLNSQADLPGNAPFSPSKRYLRILSPNLWEESERMEAEVRLLGSLFLANVYTVLLSCIVVATNSIDARALPQPIELAWLFGTFATAIMLGVAFNRTRIHEVETTYMNLLIAEGYRVIKEVKKKGHG